MQQEIVPVDKPMELRARAVLAKAKAAGIKTGVSHHVNQQSGA